MMDTTNESVAESSVGLMEDQDKLQGKEPTTNPFQPSSQFGNDEFIVQVLNQQQQPNQQFTHPQQTNPALVDFLDYVQQQTGSNPIREGYPYPVMTPQTYLNPYDPNYPPLILSRPASDAMPAGYVRKNPYKYYQPQAQSNPWYYYGTKQMSYKRTKRAVEKVPSNEELMMFEKDLVMKLQQKEERETEKTKCVLTEMGYLNAETEQVNIDYARDELRMLDLEDELEQNLLQTMDGCYQLAMSYPVDLLYESNTSVDLARSLKFFKCNHDNRLKVCLRHYFSSKFEG